MSDSDIRPRFYLAVEPASLAADVTRFQKIAQARAGASMPRVCDSDVRLRLYMRVVAVKESSNLAADVKRVKKMAEALLSAPVFAAVTQVKVDDRKPKKVTAKTRAEAAATRKDSMAEFFDSSIPDPAVFVQFDLRDESLDDLR